MRPFERTRRRVRRSVRLLSFSAVLTAMVLGGPLITAMSTPPARPQLVPAQPTPTVPSEADPAAESGADSGATQERTDPDRAAALVAYTDATLRTVVASFPYAGAPDAPDPLPYSVGEGAAQTLVLTPRTEPYDLAELQALGVIQALPDGVFLLTRSVVVGPGAALSVTAPGGALWLRSGADGFVSIVSWYGSMSFRGQPDKPLVITSRDVVAGAADPVVADGRAFVRQVGGRMDLDHVTARHLGFWSGRTGGVAWTGSTRRASAGTVLGSTFEHNHYGIFASRSTGLAVSGSAFAYNAVDGLALHRGSTEVDVVNVTSGSNGRHGFAVARGSGGVRLRNAAALGNGADGLLVDVRPLSSGLSAGGASLTGFGDVRILQGRAIDNTGTGVKVLHGRDVAIRGMALSGNGVGVEVEGTDGATVAQNTVTGSPQFGIDVTGGASAATVNGNTVEGAATGIRVRDSAVRVANNEISLATEHGISVNGTSGGSAVRDNIVAGRGASGLDFYRVADGVEVAASGNVDEQWSLNRLRTAYWITFVETHPTLLLWLLVLIVPVVSQVRGQRFGRHAPSAPYVDHGRPRSLRPTYAVEVLDSAASTDAKRVALAPVGRSETRVSVVLPR